MSESTTIESTVAKTPKAKSERAKVRPERALVKAQERILCVLAKARGPMPGRAIAEKASVASTWISGFTFKACKSNRTPSLVEQKLAKVVEIVHDDGRKERCFEITAAGRKTFERLGK